MLDQFQLGSENARFALIGFAEEDAYDTTPDPDTGDLPQTINGYRTMLNFSSDYTEIVTVGS